jgi:predicted N-acetyltransferase YhbS
MCIALTHIYVKPSSRKRGIGSSLIGLCLEKGKQAGIPVFVCSEPQARQLYLGLGFRDTGFADIDLSQHGPEHCGFGVFRLSGMVFEG